MVDQKILGFAEMYMKTDDFREFVENACKDDVTLVFEATSIRNHSEENDIRPIDFLIPIISNVNTIEEIPTRVKELVLWHLAFNA